MKKMTKSAQMKANGGRHWYVIACSRCGRAFQDSFLGAMACNAHIKNYKHGKAYSYVYKDVCTAMGHPHK